MVDVWEYGVHQSEENVKNVSARVSSSCKWTRKNSGVDVHIYSYVCIINYYYNFDFDWVSCVGLLAQTSYNKDEPLCLFLIPLKKLSLTTIHYNWWPWFFELSAFSEFIFKRSRRVVFDWFDGLHRRDFSPTQKRGQQIRQVLVFDPFFFMCVYYYISKPMAKSMVDMGLDKTSERSFDGQTENPASPRWVLSEHGGMN